MTLKLIMWLLAANSAVSICCIFTIFGVEGIYSLRDEVDNLNQDFADTIERYGAMI